MLLVAKSCPTLLQPHGHSPPGSSVHGISQARILEWVAFPSPGDLPHQGIEPTSLLPPTGSLSGERAGDGLKLTVRGFSDSSGLGHFPSDLGRGGELISFSGCLLGRNGWISLNIHFLLLPAIDLLNLSQVHGCPTKDCISKPPLKPGMTMCLSSGQCKCTFSSQVPGM